MRPVVEKNMIGKIPGQSLQRFEVRQNVLWGMPSCGNGEVFRKNRERVDQQFVAVLYRQGILFGRAIEGTQEAGPFRQVAAADVGCG